MFYIFLLSMALIWAVRPDMGWPALVALVSVELVVTILARMVTVSKARDEELKKLRASLSEAEAKLATVDAEAQFERRLNRPRLVG